jgi:excisionase family DNA binding protein
MGWLHVAIESALFVQCGAVGVKDLGTPVEDVLTVDEAARLLRIGRNQLYEAIGRGEIPHRRVGRSIRLSRSALLRWLEPAR